MSNKILVIGDSCLDEFVYCHCERLCPEAPVPVLDIISKVSNGGMAANVAENLASLGVNGELITNTDFQSFTKTRYVEFKTNHMFCRIDSKKRVDRITGLQSINLNEFAAIIISDYDKGFLYPEDIKYISENHPITFLDSKSRIGDWAKNVTFIKINEKEYNQSKDYIDSNLHDRCIVTLGEKGAKLEDRVFPTKQVDIMDLSGAGDSFLAGLVVKFLVSGGNIEEGIKFANECAASVVSKRGVSKISGLRA